MFTPRARAKASVNWRQILQPPPTEAFKRGLTIRIELVENYFPCVLIHSVKIHQHWAFFLNFFCVAILRGMWDLCSPTRDWTCAPCSGSANFNYCQGSPNTELLMKTLKQTWVIPRTCLYIQNLIYKPGEVHVGWYSFWGMTFYNLICIRFLWSDSGKEIKILQFEFGVYWEFHHLPEI